ncbi:GcrA family cell cycle regulator [Pararhodobacter oceanensis]|uniref:GcrA cell cycle regulator n=1 Tax=Pararhodobacter oceanensis TaxID=2172121 RepID=A0A2T8HWK2_9RHOB|nr:GcrA family cell cycle regulator [Pararhodobacter oceanensis]PVH29805.1 GcrA cell cycle regulator [Pararhodobacter oceanensis]
MSWTDDRVELLKKMWADGKSASQIAKELGSVTRNAVIGKVHRLGLSSRTADAAGAAPKAKPAVAEPPAASPESAAPAAKAAPAAPAKPKPEPVTPPAAEATPEPEAQATPAPAPVPDPPRPVIITGRRPVVPAGQPLPPQPSANEISPEALANVREVEKTAKKLHLMELTERTCKWPIGDPATEEFWFCGLPSVAGKPYCEAHVSVAFQPMQSRRDRRR